MEPVTHFLTGACIGRAGLNRKTAHATLVAVLAAEAADIDVLWSFAGPVEELKHHRGITHTFIAAPVVAAAAVGLVWLYDRWRQRRSSPSTSTLNQNAKNGCPTLACHSERSAAESKNLLLDPLRLGWDSQKIGWGWLYFTALLSALSHLLLDWTNNYGLRPFYPFNPRWYAGSIVFIAEPVLWLLLGSALLVPALLGLVGSEIGARRATFRGQGWAIFALTGMVLFWGWRWSEHGRARTLVENAEITTAPIKRMAFEPYPINPFRWHAILETAQNYQTAEIDTRTEAIESDPQRDVLYRPPTTAATEAAKRTLLGQVYLDWGTWALVRDIGPVPVQGLAAPQLPPGRQWTTVEFDDLRWDYTYLGAGTPPRHSPLSGWVYIVDGHDDAGQVMNGREQR
jgi:inner membrane protein